MSAQTLSAERVERALRELYRRFGYRQYKVSQFEEYDLYAQNRSFLAGERILSFTDTDGRLMAMKPDVTLSIIRNTRDDDRVRKLWYTENVYRAPRNGDGFREILQTGLECVGPTDLYATAEVVMLAAESLAAIREDYVLDLSHVGILTGVLAAADASEETSRDVLRAVEEKNLHALTAVCRRDGLPETTAELLRTLCRLSGPAEAALPELLALSLPEDARKAAEELRDITALLSAFGSYRVNLDLSVTNDTDYYNGVVFRGFVDGAAAGVLSGGRYDNLVNRMGKTGGAAGFAVYLSELEYLAEDAPAYDVDTLLLYDENDDPARVAAAVKALLAEGGSVRAQKRGVTAFSFRRAVDLDGREVV